MAVSAHRTTLLFSTHYCNHTNDHITANFRKAGTSKSSVVFLTHVFFVSHTGSWSNQSSTGFRPTNSHTKKQVHRRYSTVTLQKTEYFWTDTSTLVSLNDFLSKVRFAEHVKALLYLCLSAECAVADSPKHAIFLFSLYILPALFLASTEDCASTPSAFMWCGW